MKKVQSAFGRMISIVICLYMIQILAVMPFYYEEGFVHIGTDKSMFLRACIRNTALLLLPVSAGYLAVTLFLKVREKRLLQSVRRLRSIRFSATEYFLLAYAASVLLSYAFSAYRGAAWRGQDGWYMGTVTQLAMIASFFWIGRGWRRADWIPLLALPASGIVFLLGFLNRFGYFPLDMEVENSMFISTIGNINWYCGYMMSVFFGGFALFWQSAGWKRRTRCLLGLYVAVGFASLVTQGSSSGLLTLFVLLLVTFALSASNGRRMELFWEELFLFWAVCLLIRLLRQSGWSITYLEAASELLTNSRLPLCMTVLTAGGLWWVRRAVSRGRYPRKVFQTLAAVVCAGAALLLLGYAAVLAVNTATGGALERAAGLTPRDFLTFSPTWGSNRGATWTAGAMCFWEQDPLHKLFGIGPDGMPSFLYDRGSDALVGMVKETFGASRLTNAHNEWLTVLVNTGVLGLVSYAGAMVTAIGRFLGGRRNAATTACGFCLLAYTVNNLFSFQQAMNFSTIFLLMGVGENYLRSCRGEGWTDEGK